MLDSFRSSTLHFNPFPILILIHFHINFKSADFLEHFCFFGKSNVFLFSSEVFWIIFLRGMASCFLWEYYSNIQLSWLHPDMSGLMYSSLECENGKPSSNFSRLHYIHLRRNTLRKVMNTTLLTPAMG